MPHPLGNDARAGALGRRPAPPEEADMPLAPEAPEAGGASSPEGALSDMAAMLNAIAGQLPEDKASLVTQAASLLQQAAGSTQAQGAPEEPMLGLEQGAEEPPPVV